jgi:hypothetical protein
VLYTLILIGERGDVGIVFPEFQGRRAHVSDELAGITSMEISNRGCEHHDVAGGEAALEDELWHGKAVS